MDNPSLASHWEFSPTDSLEKLQKNDFSHNDALSKKKETPNLIPLLRRKYYARTDFIKDRKIRDTQASSYEIVLKGDTQKLSQILTRFKRLASLSMKIPKMNDREIESLSCNVKNLKSLTRLSLNSTLTDRGMTALSSMLKSLSLLDSLTIHLQICKLVSQYGYQKLSHSLQYLTTLTKLDLFFFLADKLYNSSILDLISSLKHLNSLHSLTLTFYNCPEVTNTGLDNLAFSSRTRNFPNHIIRNILSELQHWRRGLEYFIFQSTATPSLEGFGSAF